MVQQVQMRISRLPKCMIIANGACHEEDASLSWENEINCGK
jgi:hypothetical protein